MIDIDKVMKTISFKMVRQDINIFGPLGPISRETIEPPEMDSECERRFEQAIFIVDLIKMNIRGRKP